jgi:hypothetical protein
LKKILALLITLVAIFALTTVPAQAATRTQCAATHNATTCMYMTYHFADKAGTANDYTLDTVKVEVTGDKTGISSVPIQVQVRRSDNSQVWENNRTLSAGAGWSVIFQPSGVTFGASADYWFLRSGFLTNGNILVGGQIVGNIV